MAILIGDCQLRRLRREKKLSQADFARRIGMSQQMVSSYERNEKIMSLETALNAADVLSCNVNQLYEIIRVRNRPE